MAGACQAGWWCVVNRSKPMGRGSGLKPMSDKQRALRAAQGDKHPTSTFSARKPMAAKRPEVDGPDEATVALVLERDRGRCVGCGDELYGRRGVHFSVHHRKLRSQGGKHDASNLVALCGHGTSGCHGSAHAEVAASRLSGLLVQSTEDPSRVVVEHSQLGRVFLLDDGSAVTESIQEATA